MFIQLGINNFWEKIGAEGNESTKRNNRRNDHDAVKKKKTDKHIEIRDMGRWQGNELCGK